ncbi:hypothetical protein BC830DRAFT_1226527 [Chytriomyces sp. MP71]|nr:hypothetical protein BC830DRAFT_1226527 [Chytriomyces sp. MP71]
MAPSFPGRGWATWPAFTATGFAAADAGGSSRLKKFLRGLQHDPTASVALIVGRGSIAGLPSSHIWIPVDRFGGAFPMTGSKDAAVHHLWMDFNHPATLACIPDVCLNTIVVDWSTWRYLTPLKKLSSRPSGLGDTHVASLPDSGIDEGHVVSNEDDASKTVMDEWRRILKPGGELFFEATASSIQYVTARDTTAPYPLKYSPPQTKDSKNSGPEFTQAECGFKWDFDNPSHVTVSRLWAARVQPTLPPLLSTLGSHDCAAAPSQTSNLRGGTSRLTLLRGSQATPVPSSAEPQHNQSLRTKRTILSAPQSADMNTDLCTRDLDRCIARVLYPVLDAAQERMFVQLGGWNGGFEVMQETGEVQGERFPVATKGWVERWVRVKKE